MTAFSDFPVPSHFPHFLPHAHVMAYFRMYAQHFRLLPHIRFNAEVRHIRRAEDYDVTGRWTVTYVQHAHKTCPVKCAELHSCRRAENGGDKLHGELKEGVNDTVKGKDQCNVEQMNNHDDQHKEKDLGAADSWKLNGTEPTTDQSNTTDQGTTANCFTPNGRERAAAQSKDTDRETASGRLQTNGTGATPDQCKTNTRNTGPRPNKENDPNWANGRSSYARISYQASPEQNNTGTLQEPEEEDTAAPRKPEEEDTAAPQEPEEEDTAAPQEPEEEDTAAPQEPKEEEEADRPRRQEAEEESGSACREVTEVYDGVMICTGHHTVPYVPHFPGMADFQGQVLHSQDYKRPEPYRGRRVLVIGVGNSAVDIASDLAKTARQVYLSTRRGSWVLSRSVTWGVPADMVANCRAMASLPSSLLQWLVERQANCRMDHDRLGIKPRHRLLSAHPTINDELPFHLMTQRVQVRADVSRILPRAVQFTDGHVQEVDVIIMATGYDYRLDFVDPKVLQVIDNRVKLYKYVFPPHLPHATLAVIGLVQAIGAVMPISELQCRWFASLMIGRVRLPERGKMEKDIAQKEKEMDSRYYRSRRHTLQTFWVQYMDEVAEQIGARPVLWRMLLTRPSLALRCVLGPCLPAQYRLQGPHAWPHAARFIRSVWTRYNLRPKATRDPNTSTQRLPGAPTCTEEDERATEKAKAPNDANNCADVTASPVRHRVLTATVTSACSEPSHPPAFLCPAKI
ncbi:uncharacterized protein LOC143287845 [Babylonia areolata]|uniref:uncharacterized protein LOC143287845 n=1 Tax=Babylonia areolata TaxID=304850 RepID=UPI003FD073F4